MTKKNGRKKEDIAEDFCFVCKDGGLLRVCDYKNCLKCFHPQCVGEDDSLLETAYRWCCGWHCCVGCEKPAKFHCSCCPSAVCGRCLCDIEFAVLKGTKGLCNSCLRLALLIEDDKDVDSNGEKVDFKDQATSEYLFKCYWELVKEKEGLTSQQLHYSDRLLKNGKNYDIQATDNCREDDIMDFKDDGISESDDWRVDRVRCRKRKRGKPFPTKRKGKPKKRREYVGWASRQLVEFLTSIGKDTTQELSQYDVVAVVTEYCNEHKLFHPEKKKKVICDERLHSLLGRKSVNKNGIYKLLTLHFSENLEKSEDSVGFSSNEDDNVSVPCKRQRNSSPDRKETATNPSQGHLAAIVSTNIKLVYLKRSLVLELAKQLDTFSDKIVRSFVRIKSDPNDYFRKNSHMLVQVKGIKETSTKEETASTVLLQVSYRLKEIRISELSDDDFTEAEIDDLNRRMGTWALERPTVLQLERKARSLHENITKHWIKNELVSLRSRIERANEKGWRRELSEYMYKLQLLQTDSEQSRLLHQVPEVVAEASTSTGVKDDGTVRDQNSQEVNRSCTVASIPQSQAPQEESADSRTGSVCLENRHKCGDAAETLPRPVDLGERLNSENHRFEAVESSDVEIDNARTSVPPILPREERSKQSKHGDAASARGKLTRPVDVGVHVKVENLEVEVVNLSDDEIDNARTSFPPLLRREEQLKQSKHGDAASGGEKPTRPVDVGVHVKVENHDVEVIDLFEDKTDGCDARSRQTSADHDCPIWYCISPLGNTKGPYSMRVLKQWSESSTTHCELHFKVYKSGQKPEEACLLVDVFRKISGRK